MHWLIRLLSGSGYVTGVGCSFYVGMGSSSRSWNNWRVSIQLEVWEARGIAEDTAEKQHKS